MTDERTPAKLCPMPNRARKLTGGTEPPDYGDKNPAAVELGRLGGLKGGKARAQALSAKRRREIAKNAVRARWQKHNS